MPESIKTAVLGLRIAGLLFLAAAVLLLFILLSGVFIVGLRGARRELLGNDLIGGVGILLFAACVLVGIACLKVARAISNREKRGRIAGFGLGFFMLPGLPFGTVLGGLVIWGLTGRAAGAWFSAAAPTPMPRSEGPDSFPEELPEAGRESEPRWPIGKA